MTARQRLPDRRQSDFLTFEHEGQTVHVSASFDGCGRLAEIFLNSGKCGTMIDIVTRELAVVVSIALQYGVPLERIDAALPKLADGSSAGPLGAALTLAQKPWPEPKRNISVPDGAAARCDDAS